MSASINLFWCFVIGAIRTVHGISLYNAFYSGHVPKCIFREHRNIQGALHRAVTSYTAVRYFNVGF